MIAGSPKWRTDRHHDEEKNAAPHPYPEMLLIASAFGVGSMLQALAIIYIGAFLQSGLSNFVVAMVSR
jgi:hypothetical protein